MAHTYRTNDMVILQSAAHGHGKPVKVKVIRCTKTGQFYIDAEECKGIRFRLSQHRRFLDDVVAKPANGDPSFCIYPFTQERFDGILDDHLIAQEKDRRSEEAKRKQAEKKKKVEQQRVKVVKYLVSFETFDLVKFKSESGCRYYQAVLKSKDKEKEVLVIVSCEDVKEWGVVDGKAELINKVQGSYICSHNGEGQAFLLSNWRQVYKTDEEAVFELASEVCVRYLLR